MHGPCGDAPNCTEPPRGVQELQHVLQGIADDWLPFASRLLRDDVQAGIKNLPCTQPCWPESPSNSLWTSTWQNGPERSRISTREPFGSGASTSFGDLRRRPGAEVHVRPCVIDMAGSDSRSFVRPSRSERKLPIGKAGPGSRLRPGAMSSWPTTSFSGIALEQRARELDQCLAAAPRVDVPALLGPAVLVAPHEDVVGATLAPNQVR